MVTSLGFRSQPSNYRHILQPLKKNKFVIPKSRYDSVDLYISDEWINRPEYNDNPLPYDEAIYDRLRNHGQ